MVSNPARVAAAFAKLLYDPESKLQFDRTARKAWNRALFGLSSTVAGSALAALPRL